MTAPWRKKTTTLDKVEGKVLDFLDGIGLQGAVNDLKDRLPDVEEVKAHLPGVETPTKKSHRLRNLLLLAILGAGAAAYVASRRSTTPVTPAYVPPASTTGAGSVNGVR